MSQELQPGQYWKLGIFEPGADGIATQTINHLNPKNSHYQKIEVHGDNCAEEAAMIVAFLNNMDKVAQHYVEQALELDSFIPSGKEPL